MFKEDVLEILKTIDFYKHSRRSVAKELNISEKTVLKYLIELKKDFPVKNRTIKNKRDVIGRYILSCSADDVVKSEDVLSNLNKKRIESMLPKEDNDEKIKKSEELETNKNDNKSKHTKKIKDCINDNYRLPKETIKKLEQIINYTITTELNNKIDLGLKDSIKKSKETEEYIKMLNNIIIDNESSSLEKQKDSFSKANNILKQYKFKKNN